jgi:hypothetical protein
MPKLFEDGKWVIRKANNTDYYYMQHKHYVNHTWEFARVDFTGLCHVCMQQAPASMRGFLNLLQWRIE